MKNHWHKVQERQRKQERDRRADRVQIITRKATAVRKHNEERNA